MQALKFVPITKQNIEDVRAIYNYYVRHTTASFDVEEAAPEKMEQLVIHEDDRYPSYCLQYSGEVVGYALLSTFIKKHSCYQSAEVTIYLKEEARGKGIGSLAIQYLEQTAREHGFHTLIAVISMENESSITLFEKLGYVQQGIIKQVAYKFDRYVDVGYYQKILYSTK